MDENLTTGKEMTPEVKRAIVKWCLQSALGLVGFGAILFLPAGRLDWVWGWVQLGVIASFLAAHPLILGRINPELLAEREKGFRAEGVKAWDRWIIAFAGAFMLGSWVVAGLDVRFGWTAFWSLGVHLGGLVVQILGYALFMWAMVCNAFFSEGVRIQEERGHAVASQGPYKWVRHPGYVGSILSILSTPLLLGSAWAMIPALVSAALYVLRTDLEDRTLMVELTGYEAYARQTRYRLLPGVW